MNYEISNSPCTVTITVRAKWNWWSVVIAPVAFALFWQYRSSHPNSGELSPLFLVLCVVGISLQLLWTLGGREVLCFGETEVEAKRQIMFFSVSRRFPMREISEPFFIPAVEAQGENGGTPSGIGFDYQGKHCRFLDHLEEADVIQIVDRVRGAYPDIAKLWDNPNPRFDHGGITTLGLSSR